MASKSKKRRARMASKRVKLTFEQLEARHLMSVSPAASPALEPMLNPPPLEQMETPPPLATNYTPMVYAGTDMTVSLADGAVINGEVIANIPSNLSITWSLASGPGSATFSDPGLPSTTVTFSQAGTYELELTALNGGAIASDRVVVTVEGGTLPGGTVLYLGDEMQFTGNNDHVVVPHDDAYLLNDGAVAFWFKADSATIQQGLFSKDAGGNGTGGHLSIHLESNGKVNARLQGTSTTSSISTNSTISPGTWHHVALNYGPGGMSLYLDGVLEQSSGYTGGLGTSSGGIGNYEPIVLGASSWGSGDLQAGPVLLPMQGGAIDEVVIVDHALSVAELANLVAGIPGAPVAPVAPVASDSVITTSEGVAWNGSVSATDANGDPLTYILVSPVSNGTFNFNSNGSYTYTPDVGFLGSDLFTFKANDGGLDSNIATVTITVQELSDEEVLATNNPLSVTEGATGTITSALLSTTDTDNTPAELTYSITSGAGNGTVLLSGSATSTFTQADINAGLITYQHSGDESTSDSFGFTVNDAQGPGTSGTFSINVTPVNDEQVLATNNTLSVNEGVTGAITATMLETTDADNTPAELTYTITAGANNGTVLLSGTATTTFTQADINAGLITYQHDGSQTTSDSFSFTVNDGQGSSSSGTFNVTVSSQSGSQPALPATFDTTYNPPVGGTLWTVNAGDDLQAALDAAQPGDIVELEAGATFQGRFFLRPKVGDGWIYIRSSRYAELPPPGTRLTEAHAALMPKIVGSGTGSAGRALQTIGNVKNIRLVGIEITTTHNSTNGKVTNLVILGHDASDERATSVDQLPSDIVFDRVYIHGTDGGNVNNGILADGRNIAVIDSTISNIHATSESHGILVYDGAGPFKIVNNYIEVAGINILIGGTTPTIPGLVQSDFEIRGNHFTKDLSWRGSQWKVKNLFELKAGRRVLVDGNIFEYSWNAAQSGDAIVMKSEGADWTATEDVTFTNNIVRHAAGGVRLSGHGSDPVLTSGPTSRIRIENNLFEDISSTNWGGKGRVLDISNDHQDVHFTHNTVISEGNNSAINMEGAPASGLVIEDNILSKHRYGVKGGGTSPGTPTLEAFAPGYVFRKNVIAGASASKYPANNFFPATYADVGFVDYANGDYRLISSSPYNNAATDGTDLGANIAAIEQATAGVLGGTAPQSLSSFNDMAPSSGSEANHKNFPTSRTLIVDPTLTRQPVGTFSQYDPAISHVSDYDSYAAMYTDLAFDGRVPLAPSKYHSVELPSELAAGQTSDTERPAQWSSDDFFTLLSDEETLAVDLQSP